MHHTFHAEQWLPFPVDTAFAFFASPHNLPPLMPKWQQARIEEAILQSPGVPQEGLKFRVPAAGVGTTMILSFRPVPKLPLRLNWHARISEFEWNDHFCDVQDRGPFAYWRHCHHVSPETHDGINGTLLRDELEYALPGGPIGHFANALGGRKQIESIFAYRQSMTAKLLPQFAHVARIPGR